jgi:hypothetical protein
MDNKADFTKNITNNFEKLENSEFKINDVKFKITKLSPMNGFKLFERIRFALATQASIVTVDGLEENAAMFIKAILTLEPDVIESFMKDLFKGLQFTGGKNVEKGWMDFDGLEDMALETLEPLDIYELFIRCLIVNFTESFRALMSRLPGAKRLIQGLRLKTSLNS